MEEFQKWIPELIFTHPELIKHHLINEEKIKNFKMLKRKIILIIGVHTKHVNQFNIAKIFRPKYAEGML